VCYKPGRNHANADFLSRLEHPEPPEDDLDDDMHDEVLTVTQNTMQIQPDTQKPLNNAATLSLNNDSTPLCNDNASDLTLIKHVCDGKPTYTEIHFEFDTEADDCKTVTELDINTIDNLEQLQKECPDVGRIVMYLRENELPQDAKLARRTTFEADQYFFKDGILHHLYRPSNKDLQQTHPVIKQLVVPIKLRAEIMRSYHDDSAHPGTERMYSTLRQKYYWSNCYQDLKGYIRSCQACQQAKRDFHPQRPPLQSLEPSDLFHRWHMDILELPKTKLSSGNDANEYRYILLVVESLSKWVEAIPLSNQQADVVADALFTHVFSRYGAPVSILSDKGLNFNSALVNRLCELFAIKRLRTSGYHPCTNGIAEKHNSILINAFKCYLENETDWVDLLPAVLMAHRSTVATSSTGLSPFYVLFGRDMRLPIDTELLPIPTGPTTADQYIAKLLPKLKLARQVAQENIKRHQIDAKKQHDKNIHTFTYQPGDKCWLYDPTTKRGASRKLKLRWKGPYFVIKQVSVSNYILAHCQTRREIPYPINVERMKPFHDNRDVFHSYDAASQEPPQQPVTDNEQLVSPPSSTTDTNAPSLQPNQPNADDWESAEKITGVKMINNIRHYRVTWQNPDHEPSWVPEDQVSDVLKTEYHITHTLRGTLRPNYRQLQK